MIEFGLMTAEQKLQYYEQQYDAVSVLLQKVDPCEVRLEGGKAVCTGLRKGDADADEGSLCCTRCRHLSDAGCQVKALGCRMWLCNAAFVRLFEKYQQCPNEVVALLKAIQETTRTCEFYGIPFRSRHSMKENLAGEFYKEGFKASKS